MKPNMCRRVTILLIALNAFALGAVGRTWMRDTARAATEADGLRQVLRDEDERTTALDAQARATQARIDTKLAIVEKLIAGGATLMHAAAEFRELNTAYPRFFEYMRVMYPGLTDDELLCRNVIDYCAAALERRPERTAVLARLEDEFVTMAWRDAR